LIDTGMTENGSPETLAVWFFKEDHA